MSMHGHYSLLAAVNSSSSGSSSSSSGANPKSSRFNRSHALSFPPLSRSPSSPSARIARLLSPSHSLPEFLPVLDESCALQDSLDIPSSLSRPSRPVPVPSLPPAPKTGRSLVDLRRASSFALPVASPSSSQMSSGGAGGGGLGGGGAGPRGGGGGGGGGRVGGAEIAKMRGLAEWVPYLMVFSIVCLGVTIATIVSSLDIVESYSSNPPATFFHLADIHWDPLYRYHASPSSFCRLNSKNQRDQLPFGQYGCDSPLLLLKTALMEMADVDARPDFVLVTGDAVAHNLSATQVLTALAKVDSAISDAFSYEFTKRLHVLGEQELAVLESENLTLSDWLASIARIWNTTLTQACDDAYDTFLRGGYYMALANQYSGPGGSPSDVAVLVLNTLFYSESPQAVQRWVGLEVDDPAGQFEWLESQLHQARHWGRKVILAGHLPPGVDTVRGQPLWRPEYEQRFVDLVLEHSDVVVGQLFGYLHRDHFTLMRAQDDWSALPPVSPFTPIDPTLPDVRRKSHLLPTGGSYRTLSEIHSDNHARPQQQQQQQKQEQQQDQEQQQEQEKDQSWHFSNAGQWLKVLERLTGQLTKEGSVQQGAAALAAHKSMSTSNPAFRKQQHQQHLRLKGAGALMAEAEAAAAAAAAGGRAGDAAEPPEAPRPSVIEGGSASAILIAPSLSPIYFNRPAFRAFKYDRAGILLDYNQHSADLSLQGGEKMWQVQYGAQSMYGLNALDGDNFEELSSSFFNSTGDPTEAFGAFCQRRAAGSNVGDLPGPYDCCDDCPNFMRCAVEYSTFRQFEACKQNIIP